MNKAIRGYLWRENLVSFGGGKGVYLARNKRYLETKRVFHAEGQLKLRFIATTVS